MPFRSDTLSFDEADLSSAERRALRARAHHLQPVVTIGEAGLTPALIRELEASLRSHELIKVRVFGDDRKMRDALGAKICETTGAQSVQHIGKILVIYKARPEEEQTAPKARIRRKARRKTKRSYQKA